MNVGERALFRRGRRAGTWIAMGVLATFALSTDGAAQIPDEFTNLRHLPETIPRDSLIDIMRRFSLSLGVRCQYCHVGGDGISFEGVDFASDDDPDKRKARWMLAMVEDLNGRLTQDLPERDQPPIEVGCKTCHRGLARPVLLAQELRLTLDRFGPDSLDVVYERARGALEAGFYDFREWEVNLLAEALEKEDRVDDALAVWELNLRHHAESRSILMNLGRIHESRGEVERALERYRRVLELNPDDAGAQQRIEALGGG